MNVNVFDQLDCAGVNVLLSRIIDKLDPASCGLLLMIAAGMIDEVVGDDLGNRREIAAIELLSEVADANGVYYDLLVRLSVGMPSSAVLALCDNVSLLPRNMKSMLKPG